MTLIETWFKSLKIPTGRRLHALQRMRERVPAGSPLAARMEACITRDQETSELEAAWRHQSNRRHEVGARELDARLDRALATLAHVLAQVAEVLGESPAGQRAREQLATLFPHGVQAITSLPYVEQEQATAALLTRAAALDLGSTPRDLVERIRELHAAYRASLDVSLIQFAEVRAAREAGTLGLRQVVLASIAAFHETPQELERILEPLERQIARSQRRRRRQGGAEGEPSLEEETSGEAEPLEPAEGDLGGEPLAA